MRKEALRERVRRKEAKLPREFIRPKHNYTGLNKLTPLGLNVARQLHTKIILSNSHSL